MMVDVKVGVVAEMKMEITQKGVQDMIVVMIVGVRVMMVKRTRVVVRGVVVREVKEDKAVTAVVEPMEKIVESDKSWLLKSMMLAHQVQMEMELRGNGLIRMMQELQTWKMV
jgi:hypothetical protein